MSRRAGWLLWAFAASGPLAAQGTSPAQPAPAYGPVDTRARPACPERKPGDEIVVCGQAEDSERYRVKSSADLDPTGKGAKGGVPRAPDVATKYPGVAIPIGGAPVIPLLIDLKKLPDAPEGSDADRVGKGEKKPQ